jgi:hypothetical protein
MCDLACAVRGQFYFPAKDSRSSNTEAAVGPVWAFLHPVAFVPVE